MENRLIPKLTKRTVQVLGLGARSANTFYAQLEPGDIRLVKLIFISSFNPVGFEWKKRFSDNLAMEKLNKLIASRPLQVTYWRRSSKRCWIGTVTSEQGADIGEALVKEGLVDIEGKKEIPENLFSSYYQARYQAQVSYKGFWGM